MRLRQRAPEAQPSVQTMVRTLFAHGFVVEGVSRRPGYAIAHAQRRDEYDVDVRYMFVLTAAGVLSAADEAAVKAAAARSDRHLVVIGDPAKGTDFPKLEWTSFLSRSGGAIRSWLPLQDEFSEQLGLLGHNRLPSGMNGRPDDIFEEYVQLGLQFLLQDRVVRYGRKRSGEAVSDGAALKDGRALALYDAKAYSSGYTVGRDSVRQFADYVDRFHARYAVYFGRLQAFLVVSGHFRGKDASLESHAADLYALCQVRLSYLTAGELGGMVDLAKHNPNLRAAVDWPRLLSQTRITASAFRAQLDSARRDALIPGQ